MDTQRGGLLERQRETQMNQRDDSAPVQTMVDLLPCEERITPMALLGSFFIALGG